MEQKNRTRVVIAIGAVILFAVFLSIGLPALTNSIPEVKLPDLNAAGEPMEEGGTVLPLDVTPETVQSVIATLDRPESYARTLTVTLFWGESGSAERTIQIWADGDYTQTELTTVGGEKQVRLVDGKTLALWYAGDSVWRERPAEEGDGDLAQRIPTYEDVLSLDSEQITEAGYQSRNGHNCVYVQAQTEDGAERYWVETATGLLYAAETVSGGKTVYVMTETALTAPMAENHSFALPDGTVLHSFSIGEEKESQQ